MHHPMDNFVALLMAFFALGTSLEITANLLFLTLFVAFFAFFVQFLSHVWFSSMTTTTLLASRFVMARFT